MLDLVADEKAARKKEKISHFDLKSIIGDSPSSFQPNHANKQHTHKFRTYKSSLAAKKPAGDAEADLAPPEETANRPVTAKKARSASEGTEVEGGAKKRSGRCSETSEVSRGLAACFTLTGLGWEIFK